MIHLTSQFNFYVKTIPCTEALYREFFKKLITLLIYKVSRENYIRNLKEPPVTKLMNKIWFPSIVDVNFLYGSVAATQMNLVKQCLTFENGFIDINMNIKK